MKTAGTLFSVVSGTHSKDPVPVSALREERMEGGVNILGSRWEQDD